MNFVIIKKDDGIEQYVNLDDIRYAEYIVEIGKLVLYSNYGSNYYSVDGEIAQRVKTRLNPQDLTER